MVFDKYNKQYGEKKKTVSSEVSEQPIQGSSYLARLAEQVGPTTGKTQSTGTSSTTGLRNFGRDSEIIQNKTPTSTTQRRPVDKNISANIQKRLHWVETAFKQNENKKTGVDNSKSGIANIRNRINALLSHDMPANVRSELELIDQELTKLV